ncbi:glycosyl hydrolase family 95 catalytic domain-containing protein [Paraliobacillus ryukyuensis]|uniref:glycosyl hydrolase family 95 catalytic domain-containing protein n=1 Tax=Paraliobacillus ryukyuensis TaxID=200904 RepID=UPI0009A8C351|nr:glycoside hydrolase N-terminal domain-containing protein [Paraliobacillus ryukyuensis]
MLKTKRVPRKGVWSESPATRWEEAYVAGNGIQGLMQFGNPPKEKLIGNHCRLYLPQGNDFTLPDMAEDLPRIRELIKQDGYAAALEVYELLAKQKGYQGLTMSDPYHPAFFLTVATGITDYHHYYKTINYQTGEITVHFQQDGIQFQSKSFVSKSDNIIVYQLQADQPVLDCNISIEPFQEKGLRRNLSIENDTLYARYTYLHGSNGYQVTCRVKANGATVHSDSDSMQVTQTDQVLILLQIEPNVTKHHTLPTKLLTMNYFQLFSRHQTIHQAMFDRVQLDMTSDQERYRSVESLIAEAKQQQQMSPVLLEKIYDAGRYMYLCSAGELTPNLQGIWTGTFQPAWSGDFTFDTNVQLSIASALTSNLMEGLHGFFRLIHELLPDFKENAQKYYGARGIMLPAHASTTGKHVHWNQDWPLHFWTCGAGWLGHWFYNYYAFTGDKTFLRETAVPYLEQVALFYEDFLTEDDEGTYRFSPSYSAENGCADNATQDVAVAKELLGNLIKSYQLLGLPDPNNQIVKWETMLKKLPDYQINQDGALKEWLTLEKAENYNHRHFSHLYPIFQSREFTSQTNPTLWQASRTAFDKRLEAWLKNEEGDTTSTHGRMHAALCATQFHMPKLISEILTLLVEKDCFYPSLMMSHYDRHEVFNVDGNGAFPQVIHEALVDCHHKTLFLLGSLPEQYAKGTLKGTRLVNQIQVKDLTWDFVQGAVEVTLKSGVTQKLALQFPLYPNASILEPKPICLLSDTNMLLEKDQVVTLKVNLGERGNADVS